MRAEAHESAIDIGFDLFQHRPVDEAFIQQHIIPMLNERAVAEEQKKELNFNDILNAIPKGNVVSWLNQN